MSRRISVSVSDQLQLIDEAYAKTTAAANERIQQLVSAQAQAAIAREGSITLDATIAAAGVAAGTGAAHGASIKSEGELAGELAAEREHLTQSAIQTLIDTVRLGQAESARTAEKLNGLTVELVAWTRKLNDLTVELLRWTRVIGAATIVAVVIGVAALIVGIIAISQGAAKP